MPNFLNAIRKLPGLMDPERLMKTPSYAGDAPKPVASPAMQPVVTPPNPVAMPAPVRPSISAPMSLPTPDLTPEPAPIAPHPGYGRMKDFYRRGDGPIDRQAISGLEDQYMQEHGQKRGWKDTLANVLSGAAQGMATTGDWGGALGGAVAGGTGTLVSPKAGARFGFNTRERPELEGLYGQQQQDRQQSLAERLKQQQILNQQAQQAYNQARTEAALRPPAPKLHNYGDGQGVIQQNQDGSVNVLRSPQISETFRAQTTADGIKLYGNRGTIRPTMDKPYRPDDPLLPSKIKESEARVKKLLRDANAPYDASGGRRLTPTNAVAVAAEIDSVAEELRAEGKSEADIQAAVRQLRAELGQQQ
jgi:hypothetical protein